MAWTYERKDKSYDPDEDYSKKMTEAANAGDYAAAAQYEQQRNAKIQGEGLTQYQTSNQYAQYLPKSNQQQMDDILQRILNREDFSYNMDADKLYQQYKDKFIKQGNLAMQDAMGQAAALTGGYGNSYAQMVGQQAYHERLGQIDDVVPELYALAKQRYDDEGNALMNQYSLLAEKENAEYSRRSEQENKAYSLALQMLQSGVMPSDSLLSGSGISAEDAQNLLGAYTSPIYSYSGGGAGTGTETETEKKTLTEELWIELFTKYKEGLVKNDLSEFYSQMANYGRTYDMTEFDAFMAANVEGYSSDGTQQETVQYGAGMDERTFEDLMRTLKYSTNNRCNEIAQMYSGQMSQEQWKQVEAYLDQRGI